jgi:hypothetical protein
VTEHVIQFEDAELTLRMFELLTDRDRPSDAHATVHLAALEEFPGEIAETVATCRELAKLAMRYFAECVNSAGGPVSMSMVERRGTRQ